MRITPEIVSQNLLTALNSTEQRIMTLQEEAATGQQFQVPSDAPTRVAESLSLSDSLARVNQYQAASQSASTSLQAAESALTQASDIVRQMQSTAVEGSNGTMTAPDLAALAQTVDAAVSGMVGIANTQFNGQYLFAGTDNQTAPWDAATSTWNGNNAAITFQIGASTTVAVNVDGATLFPKLITDLKSLSAALAAGPASVQALIPVLEGDLTQISDAQATVGANLQLVNQQTSRLTSLSATLQQNLSTTEGANMASVAVLLAQEQQAYQAAMQSGAQILPLSLLNFLAG
jgi:flagellar hook-associated protein 3 FlgL